MNSKALKTVRVVIRILVCAALITAGIASYFYFVNNRPQVKKQMEREVPHVYVETLEIEQTDALVIVDAMGTVSPSREILLKPSVGGTVTSVSDNFYPGGIVKKGDLLVTIDRKDYLTALKKAKSALEKAEADLEQEQGRQKSAGKELEYFENSGMGEVKDKALALRKPELDKVRAEVAAAEADLEQARIDLSRTRIKAPFNAIITETDVNEGSYVSSQQELATLHGTDTYWITASVAPDRLDALESFGGNGTKAVITSRSRDHRWTGRVKGKTGRTVESSRMAEILIEVKDPLGIETGGPALLTDEYVTMELIAGERRDVIALPRKYVHDNRHVWILKDGRLDIRRIQPFWKNTENVLIDRDNVMPGEELITSDISIPVQGMPVKRKPSGENAPVTSEENQAQKTGTRTHE
ncbi:MAG: efflux RND transporter periplasmic adaptor subunit [Desulfobacteraceae bacterium]